MNSSEDWDVIWKWHWFRRALWQPHYRDPEHPEGRPARRVPILRELLRQYNVRSVLDCNCGLGLRAILLQEAGFDVTATDISPVAIKHAKELAEFGNAPIRLEVCPWDDLSDRFPGTFDAVVTDATAWITSINELRFSFRHFAEVLKPGGIVVFTGIDQWSRPEDRVQRANHAWTAAPRFQIRANYGHGGIHMTLVVARDREELAIIENFLFVIHENHAVRLETAAIRSTMEWTWEDFVTACTNAGFQSVRTVKVMVGDREHHLNVAHK